jgi:hypothetical protein
MFGPNGYHARPKGLILENYRMRGRDSFGQYHSEVDHRSSQESRLFVDSPHFFYYDGTAVGEDHRAVQGGRRMPPTAGVLRINHYYAKSTLDWERKRVRPSATSGRVREAAVVPADEVLDDTILRFLPAVREYMPAR